MLRINAMAISRLGAFMMLWSMWLGGCGDESPAPPVPPAAGTASITADKIDASLDAAQQYMMSQQWDKAQAILVTLIDRAPAETRAREMFGQLLTHLALDAQTMGNSQDAQSYRTAAYEQYRAVTQLQPSSAGLQHSAGVIAMEAGQIDAALEHFQRAAALDPGSPQYPLFEAQIHIQRRQFDEAARAVERTLALDPDEPLAHASMAIVFLEREEFVRALEHIQEARRIEPRDVGLRAQEARVHRRMGNPRTALDILVGLSERERAIEVVAFELAGAYRDLGEHHSAAMAWVNRYRTFPSDARAYLAAANAAELFLKAGDEDSARTWLRQAQIGGANDPQVKALQQALR